MAAAVTLTVTVDTATAQELAARVTTAIGDSLTQALTGQPVNVAAVAGATADAVMAEILRVTGPRDDAEQRAGRLAAILDRVRALEASLWDSADGRTMPVSAVCHSIANDLRVALTPPPEPPKCARCKGRGYVPDWTNWDAYHGEPKPKPCPDCQTKEAS